MGSVIRFLQGAIKFFFAATKKFAEDHLSAYAAQAAFYLLLAFFPFTMLICMATRLLPFAEKTVLTVVRLLLPEDYRAIGEEFVDSYYNKNIDSTRIVLVLFLIWTASRFIQALINGFNSAYSIDEKRSQTIIRLMGCLYTIALCAVLIVFLITYALSSQIVQFLIDKLPHVALFELLATLVRNLISPMMLLGIFWLSYVFLPSRKSTFRAELPGALLTTIFWRAAITLFAVFLQRSLARYSYVYGSIAVVILVLIWLYACTYCWFVGGELNAFLQRCAKQGKLPRFLFVHLFQKRPSKSKKSK